MKPQVPRTHGWHQDTGQGGYQCRGHGGCRFSPQQGDPRTSKPCAGHTDPVRQRGFSMWPLAATRVLSPPPSWGGAGGTHLRPEEGKEKKVRRRLRRESRQDPREGGPRGQAGCKDLGSALPFSLEPHPCGRHPALATPPPAPLPLTPFWLLPTESQVHPPTQGWNNERLKAAAASTTLF